MSAVRAGVAISHRDQLPSSSRYELLVKIASGGMATVYVGRLSSAVGITRLVAIKRAHAHLLEDPSFAKMLIAEAKLASRIHHPNVVAVQNVEEIEGELLLVMDYVEGASLADLMDASDDNEGERPLPAKVAARVILDACAGLHAAHELEGDDGKPLGIVHRDVSPHNILVGVDGIGRLTDFGIAKSSSSGNTASASRTSTGSLKGKVAYMAPEYVEAGLLDARSDVFSLGIVAWESLTRQRLFRGASEVESLKLVLAAKVPRPGAVAPWIGSALDDVLMKALARDPSDRFSTAAELGEALEAAARRDDLLAKHAEVASYVRAAATTALTQRRALVRERHPNAVPPSDDAPLPATPRGPADRTASIAAAPREEETAVVAGAPAAPEDAATFGSGVSAQLVDEARRSREAAPVKPASARSPRMWIATGALVVAAGITAAIVIPARTKPSATTTTTTTAEPSVEPLAPPPLSAAPPATTSALTPSSSSSSSPTATASSSAPRVATTSRPPPRPASSTTRVGGQSSTKPTIITTLPPDPPAKSAEKDKAPPNPYGH